jgi:hemolysin activation/secretion protein
LKQYTVTFPLVQLEHKDFEMNLSTSSFAIRCLAGLGGGLWCVVVVAQTVAPPSAQQSRQMDGGAMQSSQQRLEAVVLPPRPRGKTVIRANMPRVETPLSSLKLSVQGFRFEDNPLLAPEEIDRVLQPWKGRELSFPEFEQAVHAVADYLRSHGHPNAQVKVSRATVSGGTVAVAINGLSPGETVSPTVAVKGFEVEGVTVADRAEMQAVVAPWTGKSLTVPAMQAAADAVASHLRRKGYPLAQAFLPPQRIDGGLIRIQVQEGVVDGTAGRNGLSVATRGERVKPQIIETVLAHGVTPDEPVRTAQLERAIRTASDLPGIKSVRADLSPGNKPGTTQVMAKVEEGKLFSGSAWADNWGSRYSGEERLNAVLNLNSPLGYGEQFSLSGTTAERMNSVKLAYQAPIGTRGGRMGASYSQMAVDIGEEFASLDINSDTSVTSAFGSYPLERGDVRNTWVSANIDGKHVRNDLLGVRENDRRIGLLSVGLSGDVVDRWRGQTAWSASVTGGKTNLSANQTYKALDAAGAKTDGGFSKFNWNVARLAPLTDNGRLSWYAGLSGQQASKNLDSVEKFQLGGPSGVRAYPVGEGLGDDGWLASLELRYDAWKHANWGTVQLAGFYDWGAIEQFKHVWDGAVPTGRPNSYDIAGYGVSASLVNDERGSVKLVVARRVGDNPNPTLYGQDSDGQKRSTRIWIFASIQF